jgi:low affinity Fe/Cu permease
MSAMGSIFDRLSRQVEYAIGTPLAFALASGSILAWLICGPFFDWSSDWQLVVNTGTTILTWLMLFLLQSTQTRDTRALQLKLDELILVTEGARNYFVKLEEMDKRSLDRVKDDLTKLAEDK